MRRALVGACLVAVLMTPLGVFVCAGLTCAGTPDSDYRGYWQAPTLLITIAHRPFAMLACRRVVDGAAVEVWAC